MSLETILVVLLIGAIAGWLGSVIFKGSGLGLPGNIVVGILGSFVGSWVLGKLNIVIGGGPIVNAILTGAIGAILILFLLSLFYKRP